MMMKKIKTKIKMYQMNRDDDVKFAAEKKPKFTKQVLNFAPKHIILSLSVLFEMDTECYT